RESYAERTSAPARCRQKRVTPAGGRRPSAPCRHSRSAFSWRAARLGNYGDIILIFKSARSSSFRNRRPPARMRREPSPCPLPEGEGAGRGASNHGVNYGGIIFISKSARSSSFRNRRPPARMRREPSPCPLPEGEGSGRGAALPGRRRLRLLPHLPRQLMQRPVGDAEHVEALDQLE